MKKLILITFVMGITGSFTAKADITSEIEKSCFDRAWDFGTFMAVDGDETELYEYTDWYYRSFCI